MKVYELINKLNDLNQNAEVIIASVVKKIGDDNFFCMLNNLTHINTTKNNQIVTVGYDYESVNYDDNGYVDIDFEYSEDE